TQAVRVRRARFHVVPQTTVRKASAGHGLAATCQGTITAELSSTGLQNGVLAFYATSKNVSPLAPSPVTRPAGMVHRRLGRPGAEPHQLEQARQLLVERKGIINTEKLCKLGTSTVQKLNERF